MKNMQRLCIALFGLFLIPLVPLSSAANTFTTIDLTGQLNTNDFPYGIDCTDPNYVYMTIHNQGLIVKIDKLTKSYTIIPDPKTVSSGQDFYSIVSDSNGKKYINERDNGIVWQYDPTLSGNSAWTRIQTIQEIVNSNVDYPSTYATNPNLIRVVEPSAPVGHSPHIYDASVSGFGGMLYTNNFIWTGMSYTVDFDSYANAGGVSDVSFSGLVRINPTTLATTYYPISGSSDIRSMAVDSIDSSIIWVTDKLNNKIFKFDTNSNTLTDTLSLATGSKPNGVSSDSNFLYIASNKDAGGNSEIIKIDKASQAVSIIDTGAPNTNGGTFTTFIFGNFIVWTDQSSHIGSVSTLNNNLRGFITTSSVTSSNHFACAVGTDIWFAGKGSTVLGTYTPSVDQSTSGGDSFKEKTRPTMGVNDDGVRFVAGGLTFNGKIIDVQYFYTPFEKQTVNIGKQNTISTKTFAENGLLETEIRLGCSEIYANDCESSIEVWFDPNGIIKDTKIIDPLMLLDSKNTSVKTTKAQCRESSDAQCIKTTFSFTYNAPPIHEKFMVQNIDFERRSSNDWFNDGFKVDGESLIPAHTMLIASPIKEHKGQILITEIDRKNHMWITGDGYKLQSNDFGTFIIIEEPQKDKQTTRTWTVMNRMNGDFSRLVMYEQERAKKIFDSKEIESILPDSFAYDFPTVDHRTSFLKENNMLWVRNN